MPSARLIPAHLLHHARAMRQEAAPAEMVLWQALRNRQLGNYKFRRQKPVPPFIADFYCSQLQLIIELDGDSHAHQVQYDGRRSLCLQRHGFTVLRFLNTDIFDNLDAVLEEILREANQLAALNHPHPNPLPEYRERGPDRQSK